MKLTLAQIKERNKQAGQHWFSRDTMNFFGSHIETQPNKYNLFITSENNMDGTKRYYNVRMFCQGNADIATLAEFNTLTSKKAAREFRDNVTRVLDNMTFAEREAFIHCRHVDRAMDNGLSYMLFHCEGHSNFKVYDNCVSAPITIYGR